MELAEPPDGLEHNERGCPGSFVAVYKDTRSLGSEPDAWVCHECGGGGSKL